jgi:hypothetical protein
MNWKWKAFIAILVGIGIGMMIVGFVLGVMAGGMGL